MAFSLQGFSIARVLTSMAQSFFVAADKACSVVVFPVFFFRMYSPVCVNAVLKTSFGNKDDTCAQLVKNKNKTRKNNFLTIKLFYLELNQLINKKNCYIFFALLTNRDGL